MTEIQDATYQYRVCGKFIQIFSDPMLCVEASMPVSRQIIYDDFLRYLTERMPRNQEVSVQKSNHNGKVISSGLEIFTFHDGGFEEIGSFNLEAHLEALQSSQIGFRKKKVIQILQGYGERLTHVNGEQLKQEVQNHR